MLNLRIENRTLLASNQSLLEGQPSARLTADSASGSSTLTVDNISGFAIGQYILLGNFGDPNAEIMQVHASTAPTGTTITLAATTTTAYDHYADTPVTVCNYNQVEFSRATTLTGTKSVLATQAINADRLENAYLDLTNSTGFGFFRFKNSSTSAFTSYSTGVNYTGLTYVSVRKLAERACSDQAVNIGEQYSTEELLLNDANEAIDEITKKDWIFELIKDDTSIASTENENKYDLSDLTYEVKYDGTAQGIKSVSFGSTILDNIEMDEMDEIFENVVETTLASGITASDTTVTLTDSTEFAESGTISVGEFTATYTANDESTGVLSGISASTFTDSVSSGASVWQGITPDLPTKYAIFDGQIILNVPVDTDYVGYKIKVTYLKKMTRLTDFASTTEIPFTNEIQNYIGYKIERRKRNYDVASNVYGVFNSGITQQEEKYKLPTMDNYTYYKF